MTEENTKGKLTLSGKSTLTLKLGASKSGGHDGKKMVQVEVRKKRVIVAGAAKPEPKVQIDEATAAKLKLIAEAKEFDNKRRQEEEEKNALRQKQREEEEIKRKENEAKEAAMAAEKAKKEAEAAAEKERQRIQAEEDKKAQEKQEKQEQILKEKREKQEKNNTKIDETTHNPVKIEQAKPAKPLKQFEMQDGEVVQYDDEKPANTTIPLPGM